MMSGVSRYRPKMARFARRLVHRRLLDEVGELPHARLDLVSGDDAVAAHETAAPPASRPAPTRRTSRAPP